MRKRKPGRPKLPEREKKAELIQVRASPALAKALRIAAGERGVSALVREMLEAWLAKQSGEP